MQHVSDFYILSLKDTLFQMTFQIADLAGIQFDCLRQDGSFFYVSHWGSFMMMTGLHIWPKKDLVE